MYCVYVFAIATVIETFQLKWDKSSFINLDWGLSTEMVLDRTLSHCHRCELLQLNDEARVSGRNDNRGRGSYWEFPYFIVEYNLVSLLFSFYYYYYIILSISFLSLLLTNYSGFLFTRFKGWRLKLNLRDARLVRSPVGNIFGQCMVSIPVQFRIFSPGKPTVAV